MEEEIQKENTKDNLEENNNNLVLGDLENHNSNEIQEDKEEIKKSNISNVEDNHNYSDNKNDCKSTSIEKQDISEDMLEQAQLLKNNYHSNNYIEIPGKKNPKSPVSCKSTISLEFSSYLERVEDYKKKKEEKLNEMKRNLEENEKKTLKEKPEITKKSRNIVKKQEKNRTTFLERVKVEQKKAKEKKEKLFEKIINERNKKKEEIEKPLEFNIKSNKMDKKFKKVYEEMLRKEQELKNKFNIFSEAVHQYKMKECKFQPNIDRYEDDEGNKKKKNRVKSCEIVKRLYDDGIKDQNEKRENLKEKYKINFKPKINGNSNSLAKKWRQRVEIKKEELDKNEKNINIKNKEINAKKVKKFINKKKEKIKKEKKEETDKLNNEQDNKNANENDKEEIQKNNEGDSSNNKIEDICEKNEENKNNNEES
jgi:hypothetical protein